MYLFIYLFIDSLIYLFIYVLIYIDFYICINMYVQCEINIHNLYMDEWMDG